MTAVQDSLWGDEPEPEPGGLPDLTPAPDYLGLKAGDLIQVLWAEGSALVPAVVIEPRVFGALVKVDPTGDPAWSCGPFDMYVTQQCPDGSWTR